MNNSIINQLDIIDFTANSEVLDIQLFDEKKHGIIKVYSNENQPTLFLKEVEDFNAENLKQIVEIQHMCWNFQKILFLYVYSKTQIRIYNCTSKPKAFDEKKSTTDFSSLLVDAELFTCISTDKAKLETLNTLFSRIAIDTGFIWSWEEANEISKKINLESRVDKFLIQSLINVSKELEKQGLKDKNVVHKLIMRSIFLLYLEDKKATTKEFYAKFSKNANSYFKILESVEATYNLFERLSNDFNGSLFTIDKNEKNSVKPEHLALIKRCFINGFKDNSQTILFEDWRLFDFSIIRIELLSEIYENFLSELDKKEKKNTGTFYTPPSLVELILNKKLPIDRDKTNYNIKTLDPSCGSGIFLVQSFKRLVKRYENKHNTKLTDFNTLVDILQTNIFGIEIDEKSIKVAAFSLYLALLENLDPKTGWWNRTIQFPYLINDPEDKALEDKQGNNLFRRDTISDLSKETLLQNFQLLVGNPPFGTKNLSNSIANYCEGEGFAKEMVLPFLHKATILAPKGEIALIFNTKVLTNTGGTYQNFREWLFNKNYVEKIYNFSILRKAPKFSGGQLFGSAVEPISIVFYQKETPEAPKDTINYYAPKTYVKNDVLEGIVIDSSDEKHLPRIECQKPDTKIWKIAMWGSYLDFELINNLTLRNGSIQECFFRKSVSYKIGLHGASDSKDFIPDYIVQTDSIERFYTPKSAINLNEKFYRKIDSNLFKPPYIAIKKGQKNNLITASLIIHEAYCMSGVYIINNNISEIEKKCILGLINSRFATYFLFLVSSSWGIEREQIMSNEFLSLPYLFDETKMMVKLSSKIDDVISIKKSNEINQDISHLEKEIDQIIYNDILKLTPDEQIIIQDTLDYSLDLFEKQEKSLAIFPVINIEDYINRLAKELNNWLADVDLTVSTTIYNINRNCPLYMVKISFGDEQKPVFKSNENVFDELKRLDRKLWKEEAQNLYFRKKLNYYDGDDVYIIKPNQRRFWSQTAAMEDSKTLIVEILKMKE